MDWHDDFHPDALAVPADYVWKTAYNGKLVENAFAILGVGRDQTGLHADVSDGVNKFGLSVQKLTFSNKSGYVSVKTDNKLQLAPFEFVMWALGNCRSVADLVNKLEEVELMTDEFSNYKFGRNDLHFAACDRTGRMISIEPLDRKLIVVENPIGVVTNAPKFAREIEKLSDYLDLDMSGHSSEPNKISTGNFSGKLVWPGGFTPTARFVRAAVLKEHAVLPLDEPSNVIETWHILNAVTVPRSADRSDTSTIYRSAVALDSCTLYLQKYDDFSISSYKF
jgi:choloylglycine hydrolase